MRSKSLLNMAAVAGLALAASGATVAAQESMARAITVGGSLLGGFNPSASPNGGRNRIGRTVKADQRRALKRRNKARFNKR